MLEYSLDKLGQYLGPGACLGLTPLRVSICKFCLLCIENTSITLHENKDYFYINDGRYLSKILYICCIFGIMTEFYLRKSYLPQVTTAAQGTGLSYHTLDTVLPRALALSGAYEKQNDNFSSPFSTGNF